MASRSWLPGDLAVAVRALQAHPVKCAEWACVASMLGSGRRGGMHGKRAEQDGDVCGRVAWIVSPGERRCRGCWTMCWPWCLSARYGSSCEIRHVPGVAPRQAAVFLFSAHRGTGS